MSLEHEIDIIFSSLPGGGQEPAAASRPLLALLEQATSEMGAELFQNGYSQKLRELREFHSGRLVDYWRGVAMILSTMEIQINPLQGEKFINVAKEGEKLSFFQLPKGVYKEGVASYEFGVETPDVNSSLSADVEVQTGKFVHRPKMSLNIKKPTTGEHNTVYTVELGDDNRIGSLTYTVRRNNPVDNHLEAESTLILRFSRLEDLSSFVGIEVFDIDGNQPS